MKDGDHYPLMQYLSDSEPVYDAYDAEPEVAALSPGPSGSEQSDAWALPVDDFEEPIRPVSGEPPEVRIASIVPEILPEWWSDAWTKLGTHMYRGGITMSLDQTTTTI
jgi:hypothetical protein